MKQQTKSQRIAELEAQNAKLQMKVMQSGVLEKQVITLLFGADRDVTAEDILRKITEDKTLLGVYREQAADSTKWLRSLIKPVPKAEQELQG